MDRELAVVDGRAVYIRLVEKDGRKYPEIIPDEPPECCRGVVYASRTEALRHIEEGIEPKSLAEAKLKQDLAEAKQQIQQLMARVQAAEQKAERAEEKADQAEKKAAELEEIALSDKL